MLSHSHIVTIYDVGEVDGVPYIAMEHIAGRPLDEILRDEGRLTVERVLALGAQIARALAYAHGRGVVHRDVKPSNILICDHGRTAKLLDFGIARVAAGNDQDVQRTQAGQVMGTPRYMSPEQAMGLPLDARSDLFAAGAILFRECPRGLCFIIGKLLAKKPVDRFADAALLGDALEREREAATQDRETGPRAMALRFKLPLILVSTATLALALSVGLVLDRQNATMTDMAISSGASMTDFVARNAALRIADNAGLPAQSQDWLPLQAFVETAVKDRHLHKITIADDQGVVRAAGDKRLIGSRLPANAADEARVTPEGIHFTRGVQYAGANFGRVDIVMDRSALDAAMERTRVLLFALALFVIGMIGAIAYGSARQLSLPLRRLRAAIEEAASGNNAFRLSHRRNDEIGRLFDAFNQLADTIETGPGAGGPVADALEALRTRIAAPPARDRNRNAA